MRLASKLFRKKLAVTALEAFLSPIGIDQCRTTYHDVRDKDLRLPTAISVYALFLSHAFASGLRDLLTTTDRKSKFAGKYFPYDAVAFEAAAYCYYWVMRDKLNSDYEHLDEEFDEDLDDDRKGEEDYFACLTTSSQITSSFIDKKVPFNLPDDVLLKRILSYSSHETSESARPEEQFFYLLVSSVQSGSPLVKTHVGVDSSLSLQLAVTSYIQIFESTRLAEFKKAARVMRLADKEGVL
jgi:hypothetical protein